MNTRQAIKIVQAYTFHRRYGRGSTWLKAFRLVRRKYFHNGTFPAWLAP